MKLKNLIKNKPLRLIIILMAISITLIFIFLQWNTQSGIKILSLSRNIDISNLIFPLNCDTLTFDQNTKKFSGTKPINGFQNEKLKSNLKGMQNIKYGTFGIVTWCDMGDTNSLLIHEKFIFEKNVNGSNVDITILNKDLEMIKNSALIVDYPNVSCSQSLKLTKNYQLYLECKSKSPTNSDSVYMANLNNGSSQNITIQTIKDFVKKDIASVQTGPHDKFCYPDNLNKIPDFALAGFVCDQSLKPDQRIILEEKMSKLNDGRELGSINYCITEKNEVLAAVQDSFKQQDKRIYFFMFDSSNNLIGQSRIDKNISCNKPALITRSKNSWGFFNGDLLVYYKCDYRNLDLYELNMSKNTSFPITANKCY